VNSREANAHVKEHASLLDCKSTDEFYLTAALRAKLPPTPPSINFIFGIVTHAGKTIWGAAGYPANAPARAKELAYSQCRQRLAKELVTPEDEKKMREADRGSEPMAPIPITRKEQREAQVCFNEWHLSYSGAGVDGEGKPVVFHRCPDCGGDQKDPSVPKLEA
jgi:hypothetical protein